MDYMLGTALNKTRPTSWKELLSLRLLDDISMLSEGVFCILRLAENLLYKLTSDFRPRPLSIKRYAAQFRKIMVSVIQSNMKLLVFQT